MIMGFRDQEAARFRMGQEQPKVSFTMGGASVRNCDESTPRACFPRATIDSVPTNGGSRMQTPAAFLLHSLCRIDG